MSDIEPAVPEADIPVQQPAEGHGLWPVGGPVGEGTANDKLKRPGLFNL